MLEKLKSTLDRGIAAVSVNSEVLVENSKIKSQLANLERERGGLVTQLGIKMYEMWDNNSFNREAFEQMCQQIRAYDVGIADQKRKLEQIQQEKQQILGATAPTAAPTAAPTGGGQVCACGGVNPAGARFCTKCGKPL